MKALTVLITGANRGIGLELARLYAAGGAAVIATARTPDAAGDLLELKRAHGTLRILPLDVTDTASFGRLAASLKGARIDRLICNAGAMGPRGASDDPENTAAAWAGVMAINATGVFFTIQALAPLVTPNGGKVAVISSRMGSSTAAAGASYLYRASKAAAANIGANFAVELRPEGIAVGVYHPGWVRTDMGGAAADIPAATSAAGLVKRIEHLTLATSGSFEDYAGSPIAY
jgi:NAD(P)-dependent dehydrogenase (short-subunit alcohol dehydrogenase family)